MNEDERIDELEQQVEELTEVVEDIVVSLDKVVNHQIKEEWDEEVED